jgi:hypothetical protein
MFAGVIPTPGKAGNKTVRSNLTVWGTVPQSQFRQTLGAFNQDYNILYSLNYKEVPENKLRSELIEAVVAGKTPDLVFFPHEWLLSISDTLVPIPAAAFGVPIRLVIDGKVGAQTVGALQGIAQAVMGRYATVGLALRDYNTAEAVAKNADTIRDKVKQVADAAGVPPVASAIAATAPPLPSASTIPMPTTISPPGSFDMATMPAAGLPLAPVSKWRARAPYIIGGVLVAAGLGVAAYILTRPPHAVQGADDNDEE